MNNFEPSKIEFYDNVTKAFCKLYEIYDYEANVVDKIICEWRYADQENYQGQEFKPTEKYEAWQTYRKMLDVVLNTIEKYEYK